MTSGAAGAAINPERYEPYEARFDQYIASVGGASIAFDIWSRLDTMGAPGLAMRHALLASQDPTSLWVRTLPDRVVARKGRRTLLVEVKAHDRDNLCLAAVPFLYSLKHARAGYTVLYVAVPPQGPFLLSTPMAMAQRRHEVRYSEGAAENAECKRLLGELGLDWEMEPVRTKVGIADPYFLVLARELKGWRVLRDSTQVPAVRGQHTTKPSGAATTRWA